MKTGAAITLLAAGAAMLPLPAQAREALASYDWYSYEGHDPDDGSAPKADRDKVYAGFRLHPPVVRDDFSEEPLPGGWIMRGASSGQWWRVSGGSLRILPNAEPLSGNGDPAFFGRALVHPQFSAQTLLDYSVLEDGDVAGLAAGRDADAWISIQVERIEPADLIAVRWRGGAGDPPAGRLVATTALPGSFDEKVRLRIDGVRGDYTLMYAGADGLWQILAEDIDGSRLTFNSARGDQPAIVGPFAVDGAPGR